MIYYLGKMIDIEKNYRIYDVKPVGFVDNFHHRCHCFKKLYHTLEIVTDNTNHRAFKTI